MTSTQAMIVVGVDGAARSEAGDTAAVELGAWEAARRHVGLHLVHGHQTTPPWLLSGAADGTLGHTRQVLDRIVDRTAVAHPGITVTGTVYSGSPALAITAASTSAAEGLAVVTADSRVRYGGLLSGLVSIQVVTHARTSVLVVSPPSPRAPPTTTVRVVVGVDGSAGSADAVAFAFDEAHARGAQLDAIYVWEPPASDRDVGPGPLKAAAADRMLREATAPWEDKYPDVAVVHGTVRGDNPVRALNEAAHGADLIVVGRRGNGGFDGLLLGSVSDGLVRYSRRTIAVVRSDTPG